MKKTLFILVILLQAINASAQFDCFTNDPIPVPTTTVIQEPILPDLKTFIDSLDKSRGIHYRNFVSLTDSLVKLKYKQYIDKLRTLEKGAIVDLWADYEVKFIKKEWATRYVGLGVESGIEIIQGESVKDNYWHNDLRKEHRYLNAVNYFSYSDTHLVIMVCESHPRAASDGNTTTTYYFEKNKSYSLNRNNKFCTLDRLIYSEPIVFKLLSLPSEEFYYTGDKEETDSSTISKYNRDIYKLSAILTNKENKIDSSKVTIKDFSNYEQKYYFDFNIEPAKFNYKSKLIIKKIEGDKKVISDILEGKPSDFNIEIFTDIDRCFIIIQMTKYVYSENDKSITKRLYYFEKKI
jgi:hypothetical protein